MDYKEINDYELLYYIKENNEEALELMYEKYKPLIKKIANKLIKNNNCVGIDINDLIQDGLMSLLRAIQKYDESSDVTFYTYASVCIERKMISHIISNSTNKHKALNDSLPYEINDEEGLKLLFGDVLEDKTSNPEKIVVNNDLEKNIIEELKAKLTDKENQVFILLRKGFSYKEMCEQLNRSHKSIDNSIQRIRAKAKDLKNDLI